MIKINSAVVVEGKYDKIKLENIIDAPIVTTDGFRIFKDEENLLMLKALAQKNGIIVMTDSDSAGALIRSYLKNCIGEQNITNVYLPQILGKERRKQKASAEGYLGVEGTDDKIIADVLKRYGIGFESATDKRKGSLTKQMLYSYGLSGGQSSAKKRKELLKYLSLPDNLSSNSLISVLNALYDDTEIKSIMGRFTEQYLNE